MAHLKRLSFYDTINHMNTYRQAFTIIEVTVAVLVLAVLGTIVTVTYQGSVKRAKELALPNSLSNAAAAMKSEVNFKDVAPEEFPSSVTADDDVVLSLTKTESAKGEFCINAYKKSVPEYASYDSATDSVRSYLCPGYLIGASLGGTVPDPPRNVNLIANSFKDWTLTTGVTYDGATDELVFNSTGTPSATSPIIRLAGKASYAKFTFDTFTTHPSPAPTIAPKGASLTSSSYYAQDGVSPVNNTSGYTANGSAKSIELSQWSSSLHAPITGPNVYYLRLKISANSTTYTGTNFRVKNPSVVLP